MFDIVYNFGGFIDGDRVVFLVEEFGVREVVFVGFDFGNVVGRWSKLYFKEYFLVWESKRKKFEFVKEFFEWLERNGRDRKSVV